MSQLIICLLWSVPIYIPAHQPADVAELADARDSKFRFFRFHNLSLASLVFVFPQSIDFTGPISIFESEICASMRL